MIEIVLNSEISKQVYKGVTNSLHYFYSTNGSAGLDLKACENVSLRPNENTLVDVGLSIWLGKPNKSLGADKVGLIVGRSSLGHKSNVILGNTIGVIDSDFQGPLKVSLRNLNNYVYDVKIGDKIAQYITLDCFQLNISNSRIVDNFSQSTTRADGGFGSTGR